MPNYGTQTPPPALFANYPSNEFPLFNNELLATTAAAAAATAGMVGPFSERVSIPALIVGSADARLRFTLTFDADPGVFEIDIMESDNDLAGTNGYAQVPVAAVINALNATAPAGVFIATVNLAPFQGQFACLFVKTWPNAAVHCTALVARR